MATWMAHAVIVSAVLSAAVLLGERALELRRRPCRWLWLVVMPIRYLRFEVTGCAGGAPGRD
jgi:hypothetical protein